MATALPLLLLALGCSGSRTESDVSQRRDGVSGSEDVDGEYPMVVGVVTKHGQDASRCTGALVAPNVVLTARHCVAPSSGGVVSCSAAPLGEPYPPEDARVTRQPTLSDSPDDYVAVARIEVAPGGGDTCGFDLAALVLAGAGFGSDAEVTVPRIDLPVTAGESFTAVGYGSDGSGAGIGVRRFASGARVQCVGAGCGSSHLVSTEWMTEDGSFCQFDSGGVSLDADGKLLGIVSRGVSPCNMPISSAMPPWKTWLSEVVVAASTQAGIAAAPEAGSGSCSAAAAPAAARAAGWAFCVLPLWLFARGFRRRMRRI